MTTIIIYGSNFACCFLPKNTSRVKNNSTLTLQQQQQQQQNSVKWLQLSSFQTFKESQVMVKNFFNSFLYGIR